MKKKCSFCQSDKVKEITIHDPEGNEGKGIECLNPDCFLNSFSNKLSEVLKK